MLLRIALTDFVIVESLDLDLRSGFSVLTGETGAGKSILIDALQLLLGGRAESGVIREGAAKTELVAEFECPPTARAWLEDAGFEVEDTLLLRRVIDAQGKSRAWINGSSATATQLRELGEWLLDIHGQHAWAQLTRSASVRALLDEYAGIDTRPLAATWATWKETESTLAKARDAQDSLQRERERLQWQIEEVAKLAPGEHEWDELQQEHSRCANSQALLEAAQSAWQLVSEDESSALTQVGRAEQAMQSLAHIEPEFAQHLSTLSSVTAQLEDLGHSLGAYLRKTEPDPQRLQTLDERMSLWVSLARRYKRTPQDLFGLWSQWKVELAQLDAAADLAALEKAAAASEKAFRQAAQAISKTRHVAAPKLAAAVTQAMQTLGMQGGQFVVQLDTLEQPGSFGLEDVNFMVSGHAGTTPRPIGKVASGGELSRIALAIAVCTSELGQAPTLIFDEVDSGIGGATAETVGRLMKQLGLKRQVLAVTHLPQVAACADQHLKVSKAPDAQGRTVSRVAVVLGEERVQEVARMLGGERLSSASLSHAKEMLS
jgi:DNA repair protein RecN (Recombination protein N)